ncbi:Plastocyanin [Pseudomonas flavescens]|uniref:Plastocyanin n=1 Tax=Phytopseudomonas flavescens TaxID=29435 RepID=A0A1G8MS25_9GAMM|nr:methylamine utilization protein [Pseudomonas flavescens]SDI70653.1 Plastocyanin [Pseudomonas flavescens]
MSKRFLLAVYLSLFGSLAVAQAASLQGELLDAKGAPLANAVVTLQGPAADVAAPGKAVIDQQGMRFVPSVLAVRTGTAVTFPNRDDIRHHVYSFSAPKRFELRLYQGTPSAPIVFDKPGLVVLGCNIHDWMVGYVYITDDPWFAVSDAQGKVSIDNLPVGDYRVTLWHAALPDMLAQQGGMLRVAAGSQQQRFQLPIVAPSESEPPGAPPSAFGDAFRKAVEHGSH